MALHRQHTAWIAAVLELDSSPVVWLGIYGSYGTLEDIADDLKTFEAGVFQNSYIVRTVPVTKYMTWPF